MAFLKADNPRVFAVITLTSTPVILAINLKMMFLDQGLCKSELESHTTRQTQLNAFKPPMGSNAQQAGFYNGTLRMPMCLKQSGLKFKRLNRLIAVM